MRFAAALRGADLNPVLAPVATPAMLPAALARLSSSADALLAVPDTTVYKRETVKALLLFSFRHKLPLIGLSEAWVQAGALYALDWDYRELGAFCGRLALRQLPGARVRSADPAAPRTSMSTCAAPGLFRVRWDESVARVVRAGRGIATMAARAPTDDERPAPGRRPLASARDTRRLADQAQSACRRIDRGDGHRRQRAAGRAADRSRAGAAENARARRS